MKALHLLILALPALALRATASEAAPHAFIAEYLGTETCLRCHPTASAEVMKTGHWTWEHTNPVTGQKLGKNNVINNYCIAPSRPTNRAAPRATSDSATPTSTSTSPTRRRWTA